jgi:hypothetical protein
MTARTEQTIIGQSTEMASSQTASMGHEAMPLQMITITSSLMFGLLAPTHGEEQQKTNLTWAGY